MAREDPTSGGWCEALYDAHAPALLLYGRALGLDASEAEDVLHDVFRALLELEAPPDEPAHYAIRAYRNRAMNRRRGFLRRCLRERHSLDWFETTPDRSSEESLAMEALAGLPGAQREAIVLKIWHGLTFDEIGRVQSVSPNTAAGRFRYGVAAIRRRVGPFPESLGNPCPHPHP
ncbi:MAG: sigma-70 family RNA polymerase sigma factor [Verrucomicrobia bacterium]|nr:MAG: sigma-70 family RNA polymerase sigma factor [Verrucomicrobiota bacterium]